MCLSKCNPNWILHNYGKLSDNYGKLSELNLACLTYLAGGFLKVLIKYVDLADVLQSFVFIQKIMN